MGRSSVPPLAFTWRKIRLSITLSVILISEAVSNAVLVRMSANVQNQSVHTVCGQGRHPGSGAVSGGTRRGTRIDCRRSRRRRDQAADRASRPRGGPADFERRLYSERAHGLSSFTASQRTKRTTSREKARPLSRDSQPKCWLYKGKTMARVVASGVPLEVTCDEKTIP